MAKRTQGKREELALCNSRRRKAYVAQLVPALKDRKRKCTAGPQAVEERASNRALKAQLDTVAAAPGARIHSTDSNLLHLEVRWHFSHDKAAQEREREGERGGTSATSSKG